MTKDQPSSVSPRLDSVRRDNKALLDFQEDVITFEEFLKIVRPTIRAKTLQVYYAKFSKILKPFQAEEVILEMEIVVWKKAKNIQKGVWFAKFLKDCITQSMMDIASRERAIAQAEIDTELMENEAQDSVVLDNLAPVLDQDRALRNLSNLLKQPIKAGGSKRVAPESKRGGTKMDMNTVGHNRPYISVSETQQPPINPRKLQMFLLEIEEEPEIKAPTYSRTKRLREDRGTPEHRELIAIYKESGLTLNAFASEMGVQRETLCSYLYVNTKSVPEDVMTKARAFKESDIKIYQRYRNKKMSEICEDWASRLGLQLEDNSTLYMMGLILGGISQLTMRRWREDNSRPTDEAINRYDLVIRMMEDLIKIGGYGSITASIEKMLSEYQLKNKKHYPGERLVKKLLDNPPVTKVEEELPAIAEC